MLKNYTKEGQKLPLFGIGPYLIAGIGLITAVSIVLFSYVFKIGILDGIWTRIFRTAGILLMVSGAAVWFIGAVKSGMDESITENKLKTTGIYAWTRNPMYSGWWFLVTGISLMWHNIFMIAIFFVNWAFLTVVLINTEEKWLAGLYGQEYLDYKKRVNRCIPLKR
ncbi:MAG: isoprenylcysteine carboxylmethyltransferase family protein [Ruminococcaceae bacterium]|nr:isoprenylcysteine carboxylmethyltransferase family protein [Oscillospiraceae bacterium]